ncbi:hypothetical protein F1B92_00640 [Campylobacter sp. FMV-PI01]|uniref:Uncharacterized protein n=1 Tax=Campylobacter portucalensis TaxID=2608384 RepID=A0A6L5WFS4_9BACT|nr:NADH-ubiquinone oxidoreductase subunit E family protein [Campylobacter portucalensis]MSN95719.1 hypothetical protein [Campylobacter portucalensis]
MKRYDLRHLKSDFLSRMGEIIKDSNRGSVMEFIFEIGDFSGIQKSADLVAGLNSTLMNSLKFNRADWIIVVKKGRF